MLVKIIDTTCDDYNKEFKVRRMNYDQVVVNYPTGKGIEVFEKSKVSFITESEVDEFLIKYDDFLKIKLNRGVSVALYKAILEALEVELNIKFESLNLLRDKYSINKRGIWEKEILAVVNDNMPLKIIASGQNFKKIGFNISLEQLTDDEFFEICSFEINKIQKEIKEKEEVLARYGMALEKNNKTEIQVKLLN